MKVLPSSAKTVRGFKAVAVFFLLVQVYGLGQLWFAMGNPPPSAIKGFALTTLAIGVSYLFIYVRKYFPPGSQERNILLLIGIGVGILTLDELGKINSNYDPIRIIAKIGASISFAIGLISEPSKFLPGQEKSSIRDSEPLQITEKQCGIWYSVLGFLFAFAIAVVPLFKTQILADKSYPFDTGTHVVWFSGMISLSFIISMLCPERIWRWVLVVGLGLPAALIVRISLDVLQGAAFQSNLYVLFTISSSTVIFGLLPSFSGAASGFLIRKSIDVWRANE